MPGYNSQRVIRREDGRRGEGSRKVAEGSRKVEGGTRKRDEEGRTAEEEAITAILGESDRH